MSNPNFDPLYSTNHVYRDEDQGRCLTDDLDAMDTAIAGKAPTEHTHVGYAEADHEHTGYAETDHTHSGYANSAHTHQQSDIPGLIAALAAKAEATHDHTLAQVVGLVAALAAKADLVDGKVPASQLPSYVDDVVDGTLVNDTTFNANGSAITPEEGKVYNDTTTNKSYRWSGSRFVSLNEGVALGETSATAYRGDRGKTAYDHSQNDNVHVNVAQKIAWDAKQPALTFDSAPTAGSTNPVTSGGIASALEGKAASAHVHEYIAKSLQMTSDSGDAEYDMSGLDIIETIGGMPTGMHTGYCPVNSTNAPLSNESWRFIVHKTGSTYGWALAFGSYGSVYSGYINAGTWRGWKCLVDGTSAPLWKHESNGGFYMTANQTVTPSKPINQCRNGWLLMWSDYDPDTSTVNNADICTTLIPKRGPTGALWSGQGFLCPVATWMDNDTDADVMHIKKVYVHNDKLVGFSGNNLADRRDIVLRAVYEY